MALGQIVAVPATFWHPELKLPQSTDFIHDQQEEEFRVLKDEFYVNLNDLTSQEESGTVSRTTILNTVLLAWRIRGAWRTRQDEGLVRALDKVGLLAKKYGFSKLWKAHYYSSMMRRVEELCLKDSNLAKRYHCGHCGREIWADLSVQRGIGPVCWHKRGIV